MLRTKLGSRISDAARARVSQAPSIGNPRRKSVTKTSTFTLPGPIVLFDGVCKFCDASVQFIIARDPKGVFHFAPLQSPTGQALLQRVGLPVNRLDGLVLIEGESCSTKSTAALQIARRLNFPWPLFAVFGIAPRWLRDKVYDFIAARRYRWFGKYDVCKTPTSEQRERFLS